MSSRLQDLARRRANLQSKCDFERQRLLQDISSLEQPLLGVDRGIQAVQRFAKRPLAIAGGVALMIGLGPRRIIRLMSRGMVLTAAAKRLIGLVRIFI